MLLKRKRAEIFVRFNGQPVPSAGSKLPSIQGVSVTVVGRFWPSEGSNMNTLQIFVLGTMALALVLLVRPSFAADPNQPGRRHWESAMRPRFSRNMALGGATAAVACALVASFDAEALEPVRANELKLTNTVRSGVQSIVAYSRFWDRDCRPLPVYVVITSAPRHGVASVKAGLSTLPESTLRSGNAPARLWSADMSCIAQIPALLASMPCPMRRSAQTAIRRQLQSRSRYVDASFRPSAAR